MDRDDFAHEMMPRLMAHRLLWLHSGYAILYEQRILPALSTLRPEIMSDDQTPDTTGEIHRPANSGDLLGMLDYYLATYASADDAIANTSELDGFCTALACSPVIIRPEIWISEIWGSAHGQPEWDSARDAAEFHDMLLAFHNHVVHSLKSGQFEPLFQEQQIGGKVFEIVHPWCKGFNRAVTLWRNQVDNQSVETLLSPINQLGADTPLSLSRDELGALKQSIVPNVCRLHAHFRTQRLIAEKQMLHSHMPVHLGPKPGRNDPCHCGSGKKYKKCCLQ